MIERMAFGTFGMECDECGHYDEFDVYGDFDAMISEAKDAGWIIKPDGHGGWKHVCPECRGGNS